MAHDLTREDLKRNELGEALEAGVHFAEHHVKILLGVLGGVAVLVLLVWGAWSWRSNRLAAASELLGRALDVAQAEIVASGAKPDDPVTPSFADAGAREARARALFEQVANEHGRTGPGQAAKLWLGEQAAAAGDRDRARALWTEVADGEGAFAATARLDLVRLDRAAGKSEEVAAQLVRDLAAGSGVLPADILLAELARTYESLGKTADAAATWRRLLDEHPESPYGTLARQQLAAAGAA